MKNNSLKKKENLNKESKTHKPVSVSTDREYMIFGLRVASDFGATIAIPVIVFVYFGRKLDAGLGYKFTVLAFIVAAVLSGIMIYKKAKRYGREYMRIEEDKK